MSPELRIGNASVRAGGDETLESVQRASAAAGQFLPVTAAGETDRARASATTRRRPARGALRTPARSAPGSRSRRTHVRVGSRQGRHGKRPAPDVARQRRDHLGVGRLPSRAHPRAPRAARWRAEATPSRSPRHCVWTARSPPALVVLEPGLLAIANDCGDDEYARRHELVQRCAREAGADLEAIDEDAWLALCAGLPPIAVRMAGRVARERAAGALRTPGPTTRAGVWRS